MYSYKEFPTQVLRAFMPITGKYNLIVTRINDDHLVEFRNDYLTFALICDHGYLDTKVKVKDNVRVFYLTDLMRFYDPEKMKNEKIPPTGSQQAVNWYAEKCDEILKKALEGDQSWIKPLSRKGRFSLPYPFFLDKYKRLFGKE